MGKQVSIIDVVPPDEALGPAMLALNPRQRSFVYALSRNGGNMTRAYEEAYGCSYETANVNGLRTARKANVKEAIREEAWRLMDSSTILAAAVCIDVMRDPVADPKIKLKAAEMVMDRTGMHAKTEHHVVMEDNRTTAELIRFIETKAKLLGMPVEALLGPSAPPVEGAIEGEYTEVSTEGLEDVL